MNSTKYFIIGVSSALFPIMSSASTPTPMEEFSVSIDYNVLVKTCEVIVPSGFKYDLGYISKEMFNGISYIKPTSIPFEVNCEGAGIKSARLTIDDSTFKLGLYTTILSSDNPSLSLSLAIKMDGALYSDNTFYRSKLGKWPPMKIDSSGKAKLEITKLTVYRQPEYTEPLPGLVSWKIPFIVWAD